MNIDQKYFKQKNVKGSFLISIYLVLQIINILDMKNNEDQTIIRLTQFRYLMTNIIVRKVPSFLQSSVVELFDLVLNEYGYKAFDWIRKQEEIRKELEWRIEQLQKAAQDANKSSLSEMQSQMKMHDDTRREKLQQTFEKDQKPSQVEQSSLFRPNNSTNDNYIGPANSKDHTRLGKKPSFYEKQRIIQCQYFGNVLDQDEINRSSSKNPVADSSKEIHYKQPQLSQQSKKLNKKSKVKRQKDHHASNASKSRVEDEDQSQQQTIKRKKTLKEQKLIEQKGQRFSSYIENPISKFQVNPNRKSNNKKAQSNINKKQKRKMEPERNFTRKNQWEYQNQQAFLKCLDFSSIPQEKIPQTEKMKKQKMNQYIEKWPKYYPWIKKIDIELQFSYEFDFPGTRNISFYDKLTSATKIQQMWTQTCQIFNKQTRPFKEFIQKYNKYRDYFKSMFNVKKITIGKQLSVLDKIKLFETKWQQLQEVVIRDDQYWFLWMKDFSILNVLFRNNSKNLKKVKLYLHFLLPQHIEELSEMKIPQKVQFEIHVSNMTNQSMQLLYKTKFYCASQFIVVFYGIYYDIFQSKMSYGTKMLNIEILQQNGYGKIILQKNCSQVNLSNFKSKWQTFLNFHPNYNVARLLQQQQNDINLQQVSKYFRNIYEINYDGECRLKTCRNMNLNQLFTQFSWNQLRKIYFFHPVQFEEFEMFIQSSHQFQNLQQIEIINIWFQLEAIPYPQLKNFKNLKYLIINQNILYGERVSIQKKLSSQNEALSKAQKLEKVCTKLQIVYQASQFLHPIKVIVQDFFHTKQIKESQSIRKKYNSFKQFKNQYYYENSRNKGIFNTLGVDKLLNKLNN